MAAEIHSSGWACLDCTMLLANGETPPEMNEDDTAAWLSEFDRRNEGLHVVLGGEHEDDCPNMVDTTWVGDTDCACERQEFSWRSCGTCGSHLGGERHAVTWFSS